MPRAYLEASEVQNLEKSATNLRDRLLIRLLFHLGCRVSEALWKKAEMPEDIRVESLRDDQVADLNRLKEWLYRKRTTIRLEQDRAERRQKKEEEAAQREAEQPALFQF